MPPRKKAATKSQKKTVVIRTEETPLKSLQVYHKNPNSNPNVEGIAKSLHLNGQFKPIVVNLGTKTKRKNEILAGNHTYLGARMPVTWQANGILHEKETWDTMLVSFVDVDDTKAAEIVAADNKFAKEGVIDEDILAEMFEGLPEVNVEATGYSQDEWDEIITDIEDMDIPDADDLEDAYDDGEEEPPPAKPKFEETALGDEEEAEDEPKVTVREKEQQREDGTNLDRVSSDRPGAMQLADDPIFEDYILSANGNQYPRLLEGDKLASLDDIDVDNIMTWAGSATKDDDNEDRQWFYNYGVDSTSGMLDSVMSKMIVSFFTWDEYFEGWWQTPSKFTGKVLNTGVKLITTPDFSPQTEMGNVFLKWQLYRSRYLGRYFQEAGLKLIPHLIWPDGDLDFLMEETLSTMPKKLPLLMVQAQTIDPKKVSGGMDHYKKQQQAALDELRPEAILLYSGKPGREVFDTLNLRKTKVVHLEHRQGILSKAQKPRKLKKTL